MCSARKPHHSADPNLNIDAKECYRRKMTRRNVAVLVLGDIGRSPRMQYHCRSLIQDGEANVSVIGFNQEQCISELETSPHFTKYPLGVPFSGLSRKWFLLYAPLKVLIQVA